MRQLLVIAGLVFSAGLLNAQHGGGGHAGGGGGHAFSGGGGFAGHSSGPAQSFSHAAPRFAAPTRSTFPQNSRYQQGLANQTGNWTSAGFFPSHSGPVLSRNGNRSGRLGYGGYGYGYGYPLIGYPAFGFDDGYDTGSSDQNYQGNAVAGDGSGGYGYPDGPPQGPEQPYVGPGDPGHGYGPVPIARPPYNPGGNASAEQGQPAGQGSGSDGLQHPRVTLVFRDGHKLQVQNYALTQTKVLVTDNNSERDIPISALDVSATAAANDAAGVDFSLPGTQ